MTQPGLPLAGGRLVTWLPALRAALPWLLLIGLAVAYTAEHLAWIADNGGAPLDEDSHDHALRAMEQWWTLQRAHSLPGYQRALFWPDYYPPAMFWSAFLWFWAEGPSLDSLLRSQAPFTGALVLGVGLVVGRSFNPWLGLAAATTALSFPMFWFERSRIMLSNPQAGLLILAIGLLPLPGQGPLWMGLFGGLVMLGAVLVHTTNVYPALAVAVAHLLLGAQLVWRRRPGWGKELLAGTGYWLLAATSAFWYADAWERLMDMRSAIIEQYPGTIPLAGILGVFAWFKHSFLYASHAWALLLCLVGLPWLLGRPLVLMCGLGTVGVFYGILTFPQIHERYFLPAAPLLLVWMVSPAGLLVSAPRRGLVWVGRTLTLGLGLWGLYFTLAPWTPLESWSLAGDIGRDGTFQRWPLTNDLAAAQRALLARPTRYVAQAPRPQHGLLPLHAVAEALVEDLSQRGATRPFVYTRVGRDQEHALLEAEILAVRGVGVPTREARGGDLRGDGCDPCYVVFSAPYDLARSEFAIEAVNAGYQKVQIFSAARPANDQFSWIVLAVRAP